MSVFSGDSHDLESPGNILKSDSSKTTEEPDTDTVKAIAGLSMQVISVDFFGYSKAAIFKQSGSLLSQ